MSSEPLIPADIDLRDFSWMPLDVLSLRDSELAVVASGDGFRAAMLLWCASWHQVPAASLPNDDRRLAHLAGYGRDQAGWSAVRIEALTGFIECSDGRLYHPVLAAKAIEADEQRKNQRRRTEAATLSRRNAKRDDERHEERDVIRNDHLVESRNDVQQTRPDQTSTNQIEDSRSIEVDRPVRVDSIGNALRSKTSSADLSMFDMFWRDCPRREGPNPRKPAEMKFNALVKTGIDPQMLINEAKKWRQMEEGRGNSGTRFVPQVVTWLNQQRWSDHAAIAAIQVLSAAANATFPIEEAVKMFARSGHWSRHAGPAPGMTGCRANAELLAKYRLTPDGRRLQQSDSQAAA